MSQHRPIKVAETHLNRPILRCACTDCRALDVRWPDDGFQLMLFAGVYLSPEAAAIAVEIEDAAPEPEIYDGPGLFS